MGRKSKYSESYKREAVAKAEASDNVSQTARELGISNKSLHDWIKQYGAPLDVDTAKRMRDWAMRSSACLPTVAARMAAIGSG